MPTAFVATKWVPSLRKRALTRATPSHPSNAGRKDGVARAERSYSETPAKRQMTRTRHWQRVRVIRKPPTNWRYWARARYGTWRDVPITWGRRARSARQRPGHVPGSDSSVLGESPWGTRGKV